MENNNKRDLLLRAKCLIAAAACMFSLTGCKSDKTVIETNLNTALILNADTTCLDEILDSTGLLEQLLQLEDQIKIINLTNDFNYKFDGTLDDEFISYKVLPFDTIIKISRQFGISKSYLKEINPELNNQCLLAGQKIKVPNINYQPVATSSEVREMLDALKRGNLSRDEQFEYAEKISKAKIAAETFVKLRGNVTLKESLIVIIKCVALDASNLNEEAYSEVYITPTSKNVAGYIEMNNIGVDAKGKVLGATVSFGDLAELSSIMYTLDDTDDIKPFTADQCSDVLSKCQNVFGNKYEIKGLNNRLKLVK